VTEQQKQRANWEDLLRPVRKFTRTHNGSMCVRENTLTDPPPWLPNISVWMKGFTTWLPNISVWMKGFTTTEPFVLETSQSKPHIHLNRNTQLADCPT